MNDIIPPDTHLWRHIERVFRNIAHGYGYQEIRLPIVEKTELFKRTIGENTEIVEKEMYTFTDKQDDSLTFARKGQPVASEQPLNRVIFIGKFRNYGMLGPFFDGSVRKKAATANFINVALKSLGLRDRTLM